MHGFCPKESTTAAGNNITALEISFLTFSLPSSLGVFATDIFHLLSIIICGHVEFFGKKKRTQNCKYLNSGRTRAHGGEVKCVQNFGSEA
jgi:hypothetical protein